MRSLVLPLLLAACSTAPASPDSPDAAPGRLVLTTDAAEYAPGAAVAVTFRNTSGAEVALSQPLGCVAVEREAPGGWTPVPTGRVCGAVLVPVASGAGETTTLEAPAEAGTYRLAQTVYPDGGDGVAVTSAPFRVR